MKYMQIVYDDVIEYAYENWNLYWSKEDIDKLEREEVLSMFLEWEGIIGYTRIIIDILSK